MSDDKSKRAPEDDMRISLHKHCEVIYWMNSESQLEAAVMKVGSGAEAVEAYLVKGKK
jgi:hypothetical protein